LLNTGKEALWEGIPWCREGSGGIQKSRTRR